MLTRATLGAALTALAAVDAGRPDTGGVAPSYAEVQGLSQLSDRRPTGTSAPRRGR